MAPKLAAHQDAIFLNPKLFARVKAVYDSATSCISIPESQQLLKVDYLQFVHAGANLSDADKAKLREFNKEEATLSTAFQQKLLAATKAGALVIDNKAELAGLSDQEIAAAAEAAKDRKLAGKWVIPLQNTTQQPLLRVAHQSRRAREAVRASWTRAEKGDANDTRAIISRLAQLRAAKSEAARLSELCRVRALRPDGEDAGGGAEVHRAAGRRPTARQSRPTRRSRSRRRSTRAASTSI